MKSRLFTVLMLAALAVSAHAQHGPAVGAGGRLASDRPAWGIDELPRRPTVADTPRPVFAPPDERHLSERERAELREQLRQLSEQRSEQRARSR